MPEWSRLGVRRVTPRRLAHCFECDAETIQWLTGIRTGSPGSYRGTRVFQYYTCAECGEEAV